MILKTEPSLPIHSKLVFFLWFCACILSACNEGRSIDLTSREVVNTPAEINTRAEDIIEGTLKHILNEDPGLPDSFRFRNAGIMDSMYEKNHYLPLWSSNGSFNKAADSLFRYIDSCRLLGLIPSHYFQGKLLQVRNQLQLDTSREKKLNASLWAYSDLMLTTSFIEIVKDLKAGRLLPDSVLARDTSFSPRYFLELFYLFPSITADSFSKRLEPLHADYWKIRSTLPAFLANADLRHYTYIESKDSLELRKQLYKRLTEEDTSLILTQLPDSSQLSLAIKNFQKRKKLREDGKFTMAIVNRLNQTDEERFIRIAINLDRFKQLQNLPEQHIWVNIPGFYLELRERDSVPITSKICVGKPATQTPILTSAITDMITYPKWTIPESIIKKEILPGLKRDAGYTIKKGYSLIDKEGNEVDPYSVNWSKFKEYIPYKVVQGSGDDNALGVLKFNFPNKHAVYLHDTNQRYLFSRTNRALSHGCVRVQAWYELSKYLLKNDSLQTANAIPLDSLDTWLATKQKKYIPVRKPVPLFIRYYTCNVLKGKIVFYDDIYLEDKKFREKFITNPLHL